MSKSIMQSDWEHCYICGGVPTDVHHICNAPCKKASERYGGLLHLCHKCHMGLHNNSIRLRQFKQSFQREFLSKYSQEQWMKEFHKNYL